MPNMFGGDQMHPAYAPQTRLQPNQVVVGNDLWTIDLEGKKVTMESVDGRVVTHQILNEQKHSFPKPVEKRLDKLFNAAAFMGGVGDEIWD